MQSPYAAYNVFRNPFGELTRAERGELAVVEELDQWLEVLADDRAALQFVGDCGFGKTTHLLALQRALPHAAYVYYPEIGPRPALPDVRPVLVDEANRMGFSQRRRMLRGTGPIAIGTHIDYALMLRQAGFQVTSINVEQPKSPEMLAKILNLRIEASRVDGSLQIPVIDQTIAEKLCRRFGSNLRCIEQFLYDCFQHAIWEKQPWPPAI